MSDLEARIRNLEDIAEIKRLKADYCLFADIWHDDPDRGRKFGALFTEDGSWDVGHKRCVGSAEIEEELMRLPDLLNLKLGLHIAVNPRIDIDGDTATGTWVFMIPVIAKGAERPIWNVGMYFERYVRTLDGWRFQEVRLNTAFSAES